MLRKRHTKRRAANAKLNARDILNEVRDALAALPRGDSRHGFYWVTASALLAKLPKETSRRLIRERGKAGQDLGRPHYTAAGVIARACKMLESEIWIDFCFLYESKFLEGGRHFKRGYEPTAIYRIREPRTR